jgi:hypothetical protein
MISNACFFGRVNLHLAPHFVMHQIIVERISSLQWWSSMRSDTRLIDFCFCDGSRVDAGCSWILNTEFQFLVFRRTNK